VAALDRWAVPGALLVKDNERGDRCQPRECRCDAYARSCAWSTAASATGRLRDRWARRSTVALSLERAAAAGLGWPLRATLSEARAGGDAVCARSGRSWSRIPVHGDHRFRWSWL